MNYEVKTAYDSILVGENVFIPADDEEIAARKAQKRLIEYPDLISRLKAGTHNGVYTGEDENEDDVYSSLFLSTKGYRGFTDQETDGSILVRKGIKNLNFLKEAGIIEIRGGLTIQHMNLESLEGCPQKIGEEFNCDHNWIKSLKSGPLEVGGDYSCTYNHLNNLIGSPRRIAGNFSCNDNYDLTLEGSPEEIIGDFTCSHIKTLKGISKFVGGDFVMYGLNLSKITKRMIYLECDVQGDVKIEK